MKASLQELGPAFNTDRMVPEDERGYYVPSARRYQELAARGMAAARELAAWQARLRSAWPAVRVEHVDVPPRNGLQVGDEIPVEARVRLGELTPSDVEVELCYGPLD